MSIGTLLLVVSAGALLVAQQPPPPQNPAQIAPQAQLLTIDQLSTLVAPIALYPDALLSQVLVAATYPLEIVEAGQWLQQNPNLRGTELMQAAQGQSWDPSVQALVAFPDVIARLNSDIRWTTDLGNAFLAQQADVMAAVQRLREQAQAAGKLYSNAQQTVTVQNQGGESEIAIAPANPEVVYVPAYNPEYIWGPPVWGYYPPLYYPSFGFGFGYGSGIYLSGFFGSGFGWSNWGWGPNWYGRTIVTNAYFFNHYGFRRDGYGGYGGRYGGVWAHNPEHRMGIAYPNRSLATRYAGAGGGNWGGGRYGGQRYPVQATGNYNRGNFNAAAQRNLGGTPMGAATGGWRRFGSPEGAGNVPASGRNAFTGQGAAGGNSWSRFGQPEAQPGYRSNPGTGSGYRAAPYAAPSGGGNRGVPYAGSVYSGPSRSMPYAGSGYSGPSRSVPYAGGGYSAPSRSVPYAGSGYSGPSRSMPYAGSGYSGASRAMPYYGGGQQAPSFRSAPSYGGGNYRGSSGGGFSAPRAAPSFRAAPSYNSGGGGFRGFSGGGGNSRGGGDGGSGFHGGSGGGGGSRGGGGGGRHR